MPIRVLSMDKPEGFNSNKAFAGASMNSNETQNNPSAEYQLTSPFTARSNAWGSSSIWSGPVPNGLSSKTATRDSSRTRENSQQSLSNTIGDIEGKTGSASLVESSVSDEGLYPTTWGTKRPGPSNSVSSGRAISQATYNEPPTRGGSIPGLPQSFGNVMHSSQAFAQGTRPPTINLTSTSAFHSRPNVSSSFSGDTTDRGEQGGPPWNVYTKLSRPSEPSQRKQDSAVSGWFDSSTTPSPSDERRPQGNNLYSRNANIPVSRESSMAPPGQMDEPPVFTHPDYSRPSQHVTPASSRAPSMSSRNGAFGNYLAPAADTVPLQFSKLSLNSDSRPSTSHKSIGGHSSHPSAVSAISSFSRSSFPTPASDRTKHDYFGEGDQPSMGHRQADSYSSQTALVPYTGYQSPAQSQRYPQNYGNNFEMRPNQGFANSMFQSRPHEFYSAKPSPNNHTVPPSRRPANVPDLQMCYDPRVASQLHSQFAAMYPQYQVPPMSHGAPSPYMSYSLSNLEVGPIVAHQQMQPRDLSSSEAVQSALLTEFKSNANKSKRFELRDIYDHISEFSGDQYGSRFIQTKLETANSDEKERVFKEIEPNAIQLMTDVFGNYVIQKLFEHGDQRHKKILANKMRNRVLNLSLQMYGCRVVQKALDHVLVDQQAQLVRELDSSVIRCVKDQHGNHVIQKAIERCPVSSIEFVISAFRGQVQHLSIHPYGCRVIQRCLEKGDPPTNAMILSELVDSIPSMIQDQYGNYVVQHIVCHDDGEAKQRVLHIVAQNLECYSKHKFASNVVEKCLERSDDYWRRSVVFDLVQGSQMRPEEGAVVSMIKDNYGNYVIQKLLDTLSGDDHRVFLDILRPAMNAAKRNGCGKQVLAIDKKMHRFPTAPAGNGTYGQHGYHQAALQITYGSNYSSTTATPPPPALTADSQSFQSSRMPSINGDTVEGAMAERASHETSGMNGLLK